MPLLVAVLFAITPGRIDVEAVVGDLYFGKPTGHHSLSEVLDSLKFEPDDDFWGMATWNYDTLEEHIVANLDGDIKNRTLAFYTPKGQARIINEVARILTAFTHGDPPVIDGPGRFRSLTIYRFYASKTRIEVLFSDYLPNWVAIMRKYNHISRM